MEVFFCEIDGRVLEGMQFRVLVELFKALMDSRGPSVWGAV